MRRIRSERGQSTAEYFIMMAVVLAAVLVAGVLGRVRSSMGTFFDAAAGAITGSAAPSLDAAPPCRVIKE
jgi:Flp pilus assembly pilin Flp